MDKYHVKKALNDAVALYNERVEEYIRTAVDSEELKTDYRELGKITMDTFNQFKEIIVALTDD